MPVRIEYGLREGWKATQNERFGEALELRFWAVKANPDGTDKLLFRYAPCLEDEHIFNEMWNTLKKYDDLLKTLRGLTFEVEGTSKRLKGTAEKCGGP